ncbi:MAG: hypothetical protein J3Q66DRAFT_399429 [Benniella sp.]|nr:MAG: hypothetical protein J3Q66DRAFT_399429 [Benniella sp.]
MACPLSQIERPLSSILCVSPLLLSTSEEDRSQQGSLTHTAVTDSIHDSGLLIAETSTAKADGDDNDSEMNNVRSTSDSMTDLPIASKANLASDSFDVSSPLPSSAASSTTSIFHDMVDTTSQRSSPACSALVFVYPSNPSSRDG